MGICCEPSDSGDQGVLKDLEPLSIEGIKDKYTVWEYQQAFSVTPFKAFKEAVNSALEACGDEGFVTLTALADLLTTKAWSPLTKPDSALAKLLTSSFFKDESAGQSADQIDAQTLILFGILHCRDSKKNMEKARGLYEVLQDGGFERHTHISAGDKDFKPTFEKMCTLVTCDLW